MDIARFYARARGDLPPRGSRVSAIRRGVTRSTSPRGVARWRDAYGDSMPSGRTPCSGQPSNTAGARGATRRGRLDTHRRASAPDAGPPLSPQSSRRVAGGRSTSISLAAASGAAILRGPMPATHHGRCGICNEEKRVSYLARTESDVCSRCYKRDLQPRQPCIGCGKLRPLAFRTTDATGYCAPCYLANIHTAVCSGCGLLRSIAVRSEGAPLCHSCWARSDSAKDTCGGCGEIVRVAIRLPNGDSLCASCHGRPHEPCVGCHLVRSVSTRDAAGRAICGPCSRLGCETPCSGCGNTRPVYARRDDGGALCESCGIDQRAPEVCGRCSHLTKRAKARDPDGRAVCVRCYARDESRWEACGGCGRRRRPVQRLPDGTVLCDTCRKRVREGRRAPSPNGAP